MTKKHLINAKQRLSYISDLEENWGGEYQLPVPPETIMRVSDFLRNLAEGSPDPDIYPNADGTVTVELALDEGQNTFLIQPWGVVNE